MKNKLLFSITILSFFTSTLCFSQNNYHKEEAYDPVKIERGKANMGILLGIPIDTARIEYGIRINYALNEMVHFGGAFNFVPNYDTASYEVELVVKYVFSAWGVVGIYPRLGGQVRFWALNNPSIKPLVLVKGIGITRNIKFLSVFTEYSWEQELSKGAFKIGVLYNFE